MRAGFSQKLIFIKSKISELLTNSSENRVSIAQLAVILGYSPHYLKYQILKHLALLDKCYQLDRDYVKYTC